MGPPRFFPFWDFDSLSACKGMVRTNPKLRRQIAVVQPSPVMSIRATPGAAAEPAKKEASRAVVHTKPARGSVAPAASRAGKVLTTALDEAKSPGGKRQLEQKFATRQKGDGSAVSPDPRKEKSDDQGPKSRGSDAAKPTTDTCECEWNNRELVELMDAVRAESQGTPTLSSHPKWASQDDYLSA